MDGAGMVLAAAVAFVGTHLALSHPLRRPLVSVLGEKAFAGLYSLVAVVTLGALAWAYSAAPATEPAWAVGDGLWGLATVAMLVASILLMGSLIGNPALPGARVQVAMTPARGVYGVTRHPMLWSFAIWGGCHIMVWPITKNFILCGAIIFLSLVGTAMQDRKKMLLDPLGWPAWQARTSALPFLAIAQGRARFGGFGPHAVLGGTVVWLAATWAHSPLAGWPAGIWRWLG
ncbi:MFS transporter [Gluconacetobacter sacchari]|uniref:MFS transporter n=1 Tax=Gluconacetobacter sacchari TaxID=92759 RepID=A0A7W4NRW1_9PROT|nr:MFS transporter [Gluconacetobacter sacchari]